MAWATRRATASTRGFTSTPTPLPVAPRRSFAIRATMPVLQAISRTGSSDPSSTPLSRESIQDRRNSKPASACPWISGGTHPGKDLSLAIGLLGAIRCRHNASNDVECGLAVSTSGGGLAPSAGIGRQLAFAGTGDIARWVATELSRSQSFLENQQQPQARLPLSMRRVRKGEGKLHQVGTRTRFHRP